MKYNYMKTETVEPSLVIYPMMVFADVKAISVLEEKITENTFRLLF